MPISSAPFSPPHQRLDVHPDKQRRGGQMLWKAAQPANLGMLRIQCSYTHYCCMAAGSQLTTWLVWPNSQDFSFKIPLIGTATQGGNNLTLLAQPCSGVSPGESKCRWPFKDLLLLVSLTATSFLGSIQGASFNLCGPKHSGPYIPKRLPPALWPDPLWSLRSAKCNLLPILSVCQVRLMKVRARSFLSHCSSSTPCSPKPKPDIFRKDYTPSYLGRHIANSQPEIPLWGSLHYIDFLVSFCLVLLSFSAVRNYSVLLLQATLNFCWEEACETSKSISGITVLSACPGTLIQEARWRVVRVEPPSSPQKPQENYRCQHSSSFHWPTNGEMVTGLVSHRTGPLLFHLLLLIAELEWENTPLRPRSKTGLSNF